MAIKRMEACSTWQQSERYMYHDPLTLCYTWLFNAEGQQPVL